MRAAENRNPSTLWQHRFWERLIRDEADSNRHIDYILWNPVKHGYVAQVSHWPYSSFHRYVKQGWLPATWGSNIESLNSADFGERVGADTYRCWQDRTPYDESTYLNALKRRGSPLLSTRRMR